METPEMTTSVKPAQKPRFFSARRLALLAGVAGLGATVFLASPGFAPNAGLSSLNSIAYAQNAQRPVGFADIVEQVKPSVISVRVKMDGGPRLMGFYALPRATPGSPMD